MKQWLQLTAGRGPAECQWVVAQLLRALTCEAKTLNIAVELLDAVKGERTETLRSALLSLSGADDVLLHLTAQWVGSVQWVGKSPFRPHHKRQNWFIGVNRFDVPKTPAWLERDLEFSTLRASGPGGQHVNKTESAVRVTHRPSGLSVVAREERSQQQNKRLALARLATMFAERGQRAQANAELERWEQHNLLERGNSIRTYVGSDFRLR